MVCTRRNPALELAAMEIKAEVERRSYNMPMTNEPTTGEIVRALRSCEAVCKDCVLQENGKCAATTKLADRLENQERKLSENDTQIATLKEKVEALENDLINYDMNLSETTTRAESAKRERDAAEERHQLEIKSIIADLVPTKGCAVCKHVGETETYCKKNGCSYGSKFEWRGLQPEE